MVIVLAYSSYAERNPLHRISRVDGCEHVGVYQPFSRAKFRHPRYSPSLSRCLPCPPQDEVIRSLVLVGFAKTFVPETFAPRTLIPLVRRHFHRIPWSPGQQKKQVVSPTRCSSAGGHTASAAIVRLWQPSCSLVALLQPPFQFPSGTVAATPKPGSIWAPIASKLILDRFFPYASRIMCTCLQTCVAT